MKLLYDNLLQSASFSTLNGDESFPTSRLIDRLLELRYQSTISTDTITAEWATDQSISCIALGFHNLTGATYVLKDSSGSTVGSGDLEIDYDTNMTYFTAVTARSMEISITSDDVAYIGGMSCGVPFHKAGHNTNPRLDFPMEDTVTFLIGGQTYGRKSFVGDKWQATVSDISTAERAEFKTMLNCVGGWFPVYADLYDESHEEQSPIHGIMTGDGKFTRESYAQEYSTTIVVREAR